MKFLTLVAAATLLLTVAAQAQAQNIAPAPPGCAMELNGDIYCPPMGGDIVVTMSGKAVCGKGRCVRDIYGKITCSTQPGGQIIQDVNGRITCAGSCEEASTANCQRMQ
jgi:hypothetical protein